MMKREEILKMQEGFLTEQSLGYFLKLIYEGAFFEHDKSFIKGLRIRPDYRSELLKIIVEFDGYNHYTSPDRIVADFENMEIYKSLGYKVIRIPYFVQMSKSVIKYLFEKNVDIEQTYKHGFVSSKATNVLPSSFCMLGIRKFQEDLDRFKFINEDLKDSLKQQLKIKKKRELVLPEQLFYLFD